MKLANYNFQPAAFSAMARRRLRRLGALWLSLLLSLPGLGFFDFFATPEEDAPKKGKVATATRFGFAKSMQVDVPSSQASQVTWVHRP